MLREYIFIKKCIELEQAARLSKEMKILPKLIRKTRPALAIKLK